MSLLIWNVKEAKVILYVRRMIAVTQGSAATNVTKTGSNLLRPNIIEQAVSKRGKNQLIAQL